MFIFAICSRHVNVCEGRYSTFCCRDFFCSFPSQNSLSSSVSTDCLEKYNSIRVYFKPNGKQLKFYFYSTLYSIFSLLYYLISCDPAYLPDSCLEALRLFSSHILLISFPYTLGSLSIWKKGNLNSILHLQPFSLPLMNFWRVFSLGNSLVNLFLVQITLGFFII